MTLTDELKIRDDKIKANQAQHDLVREAAKISALSSNDLLQKFEYLTGEDLGHRPSVKKRVRLCIHQTMFREEKNIVRHNKVAK